jgi:hypothetical protein
LDTDTNTCRSLRSKLEWHGNILVVKHGKRKPIINVDREDAFLVDSIVTAYVAPRLFALWRTAHILSDTSRRDD